MKTKILLLLVLFSVSQFCFAHSRSKRLSVRQLPAYTSMVWQSWCDSMTRTLKPITMLADTSASAIHIPSELEPNATMRYRLGAKGTRPADGYPLFIYMHGSGPSDVEWSNGYKICMRAADTPSVCFIPQIPNEGEWYRWWQRGKQYVWETLFREMMADSLVDPDRIFFWGISEGGYGCQRLASFYADYLAGAGPVACGEPLINAPAENCANLAFCLTTGSLDSAWARCTFSAITAERFAELRSAHPDLYCHLITLSPGMGHHVDYYTTTPWLRQHIRNPYPKYVCWEDYSMDGRHRSFFYNLVPLDTLSPEQRRRYVMSIDGNTVNITVDDVEYTPTEMSAEWGIPLRYSRTYTPTIHGSLRICLCPELVDVTRPVTIILNGKRLFRGRLRLDLQNIVDNCALFADPRRLYPSVVNLSW